MTWQTKVASWVLPLVSGYVIPDDAQVITGVEFGTLDDADAPVTLNATRVQATYPGLVPDFSLDPEVTPTTTGTQYNLKAKKGVGFHGVVCEVLSFDPKRLNAWTFPLERRNFGHIALSRNDTVAVSSPIHYENQYFFSESVQSLALNYDDDFSTQTLTNSVDKYSLTKASVFLYPDVILRIAFMPIWEVWAIRFFRANTN